MEAPLTERQQTENRAESWASPRPAPVPRPTAARAPARSAKRARARGPGLQARIILLMVVSLVVLALISSFATAAALQGLMLGGARAKGEAIAAGLATSARSLMSAGDESAVRDLVGEFDRIEGVAYAMVYDQSGKPVASSYAGQLPAALAAPATGPAGKWQAIMAPLPGSSRQARVLDLAQPIAGGAGTVRVGMNEDSILATVERVNINLLVVQGLVALIAILFAVLFSARLVRPIRSLVKVARAVGGGDLSRTVRVTSSDEVGLLTRTFNEAIRRLRGLVVTEAERDEERARREALQENIRSFLKVTREISQGDLRRRGKVTEDVLGSVVDSINAMMDEIALTLRGVQVAADTVHAGAEEVIDSNEDIGSRVRAQLESARQVSESVAQVTTSMRGVSENAEASAGAAHRTLEAARTGQRAVGETLESMQRIRSEVLGISRRIKSLGDRSLEISEIVDTIGGISSQTNLLALNAAIEASGAGEQGARFAVVADEVRKLAEESASSSKRIASLIKAVQSEILDAVGTMEAGTEEVETGFRLAQQAGERLEEIARISDSSAELAKRISDQTADQVASIEQVAASTVAITDLAHKADTTVGGGRQTAERLREVAQQLNQRLANFHLPEAT
jgi:methyl-accepting chemotaxis protein